MTNEKKEADFKNVGVAKISSTGRSLHLELYLTCELGKPCYIGLKTLEEVILGNYQDATIYQLKKDECRTNERTNR